jgi:hypothetical protein
VLVQFRCSQFDDFQHRVFFDFGGEGPDKRPHGLFGPAFCLGLVRFGLEQYNQCVITHPIDLFDIFNP